MNSVFSLSKRDSDDENPIADTSESNSESKTDEQNGSDGAKDQKSPSGSKTEEETHTEPKRDENILRNVVPIDDLELDDFEAENRILNSCNEVGRERKTPNRESRPNEDNGPPGSRTPLFSGIPRYDLPGCSNSNDTIRNMMRRKPLYLVEAPPKKKPVISPDGTPLKNLERPVVRPTFMQRLLSSNVAEAKDIPRGKLYKAEIADCICEGRDISDSYSLNGRTSSDGSSSSDNSKDFSVPSTSNADKLLGLVKSDEPSGSSSTSEEYKYYKDDESDDDSVDLLCCTCLSSHEDEDDEDEEEPGVDERLWRKRRGEPQSPQDQKKFCTVESPVPCEEENYPVSNPGSSFSSPGSSTHMYGLPEIKQWLQKFLSWPDNEKDEALDQLIGRCSVGQVRYMMKSIEPLLQRDFISLLPKELALTVLAYLEPKDLARAARTCRYWRFLADDNLLWKDQCRRIGITTLDKKTRTGIASTVGPWKAAYMRQYLIEDNWLHKPVSNAKVMRGHDDHVITCLQFCGNRILSGSDDTTLKIWSSVTGKCLRTLRGHTGGVWSSQMVGDLVISGSTDRTLRIWNANTGRCLNILMGHSSTVRCMHLYKKRVVSGSRDTTLRVWSIPGGKCLSVLSGHLAAVRCVQYDGKVVVSGAYDYYVKVWNPETGECLHTLAGHKNRVYSLQFDGVHAVSGSLDTTICVWDVASGKLKRTLTGHQSLTSGMELQSNILVSGNADSTVKVWNIATGHCLHTLSGPNKHQSAVTCLQTSNRFVITSSDDGTVKLWDIRTGEFLRNLVELGSGGSGGVVWRIRASATKLICAVGSRNGTEETKLLLLNFDVPGVCQKCKK